jgi:hypothetical protein
MGDDLSTAQRPGTAPDLTGGAPIAGRAATQAVCPPCHEEQEVKLANALACSASGRTKSTAKRTAASDRRPHHARQLHREDAGRTKYYVPKDVKLQGMPMVLQDWLTSRRMRPDPNDELVVPDMAQLD